MRILEGSWGASNPGQLGPPNEPLFLECFELLREQKLFNSRAWLVSLVGPWRGDMLCHCEHQAGALDKEGQIRLQGPLSF